MKAAASARDQRREKARVATRVSILDAARRVAARDGARDLSLRAVATEAGFAPAGLYSYFTSKAELLLALAAEDLATLARIMRTPPNARDEDPRFSAIMGAALSHLEHTETIAAAPAALSSMASASEPARQFNGRLITVLNALSQAAGRTGKNREEQCDVVLLAATLTGLAVLGRSGRLAALGFEADELVARAESLFQK